MKEFYHGTERETERKEIKKKTTEDMNTNCLQHCHQYFLPTQTEKYQPNY